MIHLLPQHTLQRGKVSESQLDLSSWQHIFADYAKAATFSFRGTSQLFPLPCQSQCQTCNRFHLGRAWSAPKVVLSTHTATRKQYEKFNSNPSRTAPTLPAHRGITGCQWRDWHRKLIFFHHIRCLCQICFLMNYTKKSSFIHSYLCKGIAQNPEGSCFDPEAEVKESFDHRGTSLALAKPSEAPKEHRTSLGRETRLKSLLTEAGRLNNAHLRRYFNFKTGGSIALDSATKYYNAPVIHNL